MLVQNISSSFHCISLTFCSYAQSIQARFDLYYWICPTSCILPITVWNLDRDFRYICDSCLFMTWWNIPKHMSLHHVVWRVTSTRSRNSAVQDRILLYYFLITLYYLSSVPYHIFVLVAAQFWSVLYQDTAYNICICSM